MGQRLWLLPRAVLAPGKLGFSCSVDSEHAWYFFLSHSEHPSPCPLAVGFWEMPRVGGIYTCFLDVCQTIG